MKRVVRKRGTRALIFKGDNKFLPKSRLSQIQSASSMLVRSKRSQVGVEYMIVVGFITFAIMSILVLAFFTLTRSKTK
jgi:hypothetical protein